MPTITRHIIDIRSLKELHFWSCRHVIVICIISISLAHIIIPSVPSHINIIDAIQFRKALKRAGCSTRDFILATRTSRVRLDRLLSTLHTHRHRNIHLHLKRRARMVKTISPFVRRVRVQSKFIQHACSACIIFSVSPFRCVYVFSARERRCACADTLWWR